MNALVRESSESPRASSNRLWWTILPLTFAAAVRLAAINGDLALDEIWSLWFVQNVVPDFLGIFSLRHDNNHILNTMVMFSLGANAPGVCYRILPAICSIVAVWIAGRIASRRGGFPACVLAWVFVGSSYLLILYSTEARGYSYLICLAYLSWLFLLRTEASGRSFDAAIFATTASIGLLAHLTFVYCYAGFCIWSLRKFQANRSWTLVFAHVLPSATAVCLYLFFIRGMEIGGGPDAIILAAIIETLSIVAGGPLAGAGELIVAIGVLAVLVLGYARLWRTDPAMAACFLTIIILAPTAVLLKTRHAEIYPRYFLVPVAFALLLISDVVSSWWHTGRLGRICQFAVIGAYLVGNCWWTARLMEHGRGDYSGAIAWLATQVKEGPATICTDHDFRNRKIFDYYAGQAWPQGVPLEYVELADRSSDGTDWMILHNFEGDASYPDVVSDPAGNSYKLECTYRHHSLTGWNWWIYRRIRKNM